MNDEEIIMNNEETTVETDLLPEEDYNVDLIEDDDSGVNPGMYIAGGLLTAAAGYGLYKAWPWLKKKHTEAKEHREERRNQKAIERVAKNNLIEAAKEAKAKQLVEEQKVITEKEKKEDPEK